MATPVEAGVQRRQLRNDDDNALTSINRFTTTAPRISTGVRVRRFAITSRQGTSRAVPAIPFALDRRGGHAALGPSCELPDARSPRAWRTASIRSRMALWRSRS
ncbi:hypothetical protein [Bradyrhizobium sp.]|uniref:hypothetical protein n=1 Tax=Bradyrhizobium sp. TaxID=376 RepID=UPI003C603856